jgi:hypothetical protein
MQNILLYPDLSDRNKIELYLMKNLPQLNFYDLQVEYMFSQYKFVDNILTHNLFVQINNDEIDKFFEKLTSDKGYRTNMLVKIIDNPYNGNDLHYVFNEFEVIKTGNFTWITFLLTCFEEKKRKKIGG